MNIKKPVCVFITAVCVFTAGPIPLFILTRPRTSHAVSACRYMRGIRKRER